MNTVQPTGYFSRKYKEKQDLGVKERHEREREAVSGAILDAARELFVTHGYQEVSIRKIADKIEYSPAAIYSYFPSKDDIFFALANEGFRLLLTYADEVKVTPSDPVDELRQMFLRYYEFSREYPEHFALMFLDRTVPKIRDNWERFGSLAQLKVESTERIARLVESGAIPGGTNAHAVFRLLLTAAHGAAVLRLCDRLEPGEDGNALARAAIDAVLIGLGHGAGRNLPTPSGPLCEPVHSISEDTRHDS